MVRKLNRAVFLSMLFALAPATLPAGGSAPATAAVAPGLLDQFTIQAVSSRPEMVTGGDAVVQVRVPAGKSPADLRIYRGEDDVTGSFAALPGAPNLLRAKLETGSNDTSATGETIILATLPGLGTRRLTLVNHSVNGPVLSGRHLLPYLCTTAAAGLGDPRNADCQGNTTVTYRYRTTTNNWVKLNDPSGPVPGNIASTTTTEGKTVPYAVATERGTLNRAIYAISTLVDIGPGSDTNQTGTGFNGTAIYNYGGGCNNLYQQGKAGGSPAANPNANPNPAVGNGYAYFQTTLNIFGSRCSDAVSAETTSMVKERFVERWGPIDKTIGNGGSGGSMAQQMIANNYPGLLDAISLSNSFIDNAYATGFLMDCAVIDNYVNASGWSSAERHAVKGGGLENTCDTTVASFSGGFFAPDQCPDTVPADQVYNAVTNPLGVRCTVWDANSNLWGTYANGKARQAADNVGVQYGLDALLNDEISARQFLDLNQNAGGIDEDGNPTAGRRVADPDALKIAYRMGQLNEGSAGYASTPAIDNRQYWIETVVNAHQTVHALSMRQRLENSTGGPVPHFIWSSKNGPGTGPDDDEPPTISNDKVWSVLEAWVENIQADTSDTPPQEKAVANAPANATDRCFNDDGTVKAIEVQSLNSGVCGTAFPSHRTPRMIAGGPLANDILKCQLKPLNPADYNGKLNAGELEELAGIFPSGVCDWSKPGVEQTFNTRTWRAWPTGRPDSTPPEATISSGPAQSVAPDPVDFEFSASETGSQFECRLDSGDENDFADCTSPIRYQSLSSGEHEFEVRATDTAGNVGSPASMRFNVGSPAPVLSVSPGAIFFGPINLGGELGEPGEFTLANPGSETVQVNSATVTGAEAGSFRILANASTCYTQANPGRIEPGHSCQIVAVFDPLAEGRNQANLRIQSSSVTSPDLIPLAGVGLPRLLPGAAISPQTVSFGNRQAGTRSPVQIVTLTSNGTGDLTVNGPGLSGMNPGQFKVTSDNCSSRVIATGNHCEIGVQFAPSGVGGRAAALVVSTDAAGADTTVDLSGAGVTPPAVRRSSRVQIGKRLRRLGRMVRQPVPIRCQTTNMDFCRGRMTLKARGRTLGLRHNRLVLVGSQSYSLGRGWRTVKIKVSHLARRALRRRGRMQVRINATSRQGNGNFRSLGTGRRLRR